MPRLDSLLPLSFLWPRSHRLVPVAIGSLLALSSIAASAAVLPVTTTANAGPGSLRDAVAQANALPGLDTIDVTAVGTIALTSGHMVISDPLVIEGHGIIIDATSNGARIFMTTAGSDTVLRDMTLTNATGLSVAGACIRSQAELTLDQVNFDRCQTTGSGGAIHHRDGDLDLDGVTIISSSASRGGAIDADDTPFLTIDDSVFDSNSTPGLGGHVYLGPSTSIAAIGDTQMSTGTASRGGAIFTRAGNTWLTGTDLISNDATDRGGAIAQRGAGSYLGVYQSSLTANTADYGAALHAAEGNQAYFDHADVLGNLAAVSGGAIFGNDANLSMYDTLMAGNAAITRDGGAIYLVGEGVIDGVANAFTANSAGRDGGALYVDIAQGVSGQGGAMFLLNLTAHSNIAGRSGGGLWIQSTVPSPTAFSLRSSTVALNSAGQSAGGVYMNLDLPGAGHNNDWSGNLFDANTVNGTPDDCLLGATSTPITWVDNLMFAPNTCGATISGQSALLPPSPTLHDRCLVPGPGSPAVDANTFPFAIPEDILHAPRSSPGDIGSCEQ